MSLELVESAGWRASLQLGVRRVAGKSVLLRQKQLGPLTVQRAFYPESADVAHVYLLHPPGGVVHGDVLDLRVRVDGDARALFTTPAATKYYRSAGRVARQRTVLTVAAGASLEWLPQETIVFGGSLVELSTRVELEPGAVFAGWELTCLGRPASGDAFETGRVRQAFELWQGERPLRVERSRVDALAPVRAASWGLAGRSVLGTLLCAPATPELATLAREAVALERDDELFSASLIGEVLACRYLGSSAERAKRAFSAAWSALRPALLGRPACPPRIWLT